MSFRKFNTIMLGTCSALSLIASDAVAQTSGSIFQDEVIVTATKREQNAQDVSIAVSAYSAEQLNALGVTGAKELADFTAGVQINMQYGNAPTFTIRGINVNDFGVGTSPAAAVYVDGIYKASNINSGVQLFDLERVEILKGPQGTLWGKNTTGGAVNVVTKRPTQDMEGYAQVGYGRFNKVELEGAIGGGITDNLSARISFQSITSDGPFNNVTFAGQPTPGSQAADGTTDSRIQFQGTPDSDPGDLDTMAIRAQALYEFDGGEILAQAHYGRDRGENHPTTSVIDPDPFDRDISNEFIYTRDSVFKGASIQAKFDVGENGRIVSISGYDYFDRDGGLDTMGFNGIGAESIFTQIYLVELTQFSQELRYEHTTDNLFFLLGGYYSDTEINQNDEDHYSIGYFTAPFNYRYEHDNTSLGIFANAEYQLSDQIKLNGGIRYDDESRKQPFYNLWFGGPNVGPDLGGSITDPGLADNSDPSAPPQEYETDGISYKVGIDWTPNDNTLVYLSHAKGLKSGGYRSDAFTSIGELASFNDEELFAYEAGLKWDPTPTLRVNGAVFLYDYQDVQQKVPTVIPGFGTLNTMANLDSADVFGVELEVQANLADGFDVGVNASILDTEINDTRLIAGNPVDGNPLPFAPDFAASAFARYETDLSDDLVGSIQASVNHTGDHYTNVSGDDDLFGAQNYTTVNLNAAIGNPDKGWNLSFYAKNLTNEIYWTNTFSDVGGFISEPGSYGVRLRYDFN